MTRRGDRPSSGAAKGWPSPTTPLLRSTGKPIHLIRPTGPAAGPNGFTLGALEVELPPMATFTEMAADGRIEDGSVFNSLKTVGLEAVLSTLWSTTVSTGYGFREGLYDHLVTEFTQRFPLVVDPAVLAGRSLLDIASRRR